MYNNWAEVSRQLEQELQSERSQRQARRCDQSRFSWASLRWWTPITSAGNTAPSIAQTSEPTEPSP